MSRGEAAVTRGRRVAGTALIALSGVMLAGSAAVKFAGVPRVVSEMGAMGFGGGRLIFIACLETLGVFLLLFPAARSAGLPWVSAYLGGAMATHLQHDQSMLGPAFVLSLVWIGTWMRHPEALWSLGRSAGDSRETLRADPEVPGLRHDDSRRKATVMVEAKKRERLNES